ncbi:immediate early protein 1 [Diatraea saccharalis granulovirus]|uniref:Immediate early protein 1 n=1 Tax=Diatraea saccharalis granulovirus TaxID=1675862 RepID=A0A0R7EYV5_9BBAC|nr:immediate early protein 1 [Diatraea saccharalis granulovirus]AKN80769.1 immediate early protein 1 [Diatraea saccharalis granulovirus]
MEAEEDGPSADVTMTTNDSEYDSYDEDEESNTKVCIQLDVSTTNKKQEKNCDFLEKYKWLNRYKTTTYHMFLCYDTVEYVRNERFPADVYITKYANKHGNAYELFIKESKFYITTKLLQLLKVDSSQWPKETVVRHVDLEHISNIICLKMRDGNTLLQHIIEAMFNTILIGLNSTDVQAVKERIVSKESKERLGKMMKLYSWKSENRKALAIINKSTLSETDQVKELFQMTYKTQPTFVFDPNITPNYYLKLFHDNLQIQKTFENLDRVSQARLEIKSLVAVLYDTSINPFYLYNLNDVRGNEGAVEEFIRLSREHPMGDVILNMKKNSSDQQRYRLNCFKLNTTHVWISSMVYKNGKDLDLKEIISKYKWGTHYIISFTYMYNSLLNKYHTETTKLVIRYILSKRSFNFLKDDIRDEIKINLQICSW